jgi:hypothetical protein
MEVKVLSCSMKADSDDEIESSIGSESFQDSLTQRKKNRGILRNLFRYNRRHSALSKDELGDVPSNSHLETKDSMRSFLVARVDNNIIQTSKVPQSSLQWNSFFSIDVDIDGKDDSACSDEIDLLLYSGKDGSEALLRQKTLPLKDFTSQFDLTRAVQQEQEMESSIILDSSIGNILDLFIQQIIRRCFLTSCSPPPPPPPLPP